ncbi:MAG: NAD(P)-dependent alcohol dehydrogenase [Leptolyngbyaceae cyanobacterium MAG.088]|nr:NAD(P)-dependent alcohol dehydrogenase [Leptolyngbyaceae cyanobacterium MAG.088]
MKAIVQDEYGASDVLRLADVDRPVPQDNQVLVRVHASSVNAGDWHLMRGTPFLIRLMFGGIAKPKLKTLGSDVAGRVEAVGKDVTQFQVGAEVFGDVSECGFGAFAEYVCVPETALMLKPDNTSFEVAAAVPAAALAALQSVRDYGQIQSGQKVLVHGASGGVGSFAVQIAKAFGAEVTGVCSTAKVDMVRSLNADHVIDYTQTDCTQTGPYDLIIDAAAYRSVYDFLPALKPQGTYVMVGGSTARFFQVMFLSPWIAKTRQYTVKCLAAKPNQDDLTTIRDLVATGKITPFIDRRYPLSDVPDAIRYVEQRQVKGKVVITL